MELAKKNNLIPMAGFSSDFSQDPLLHDHKKGFESIKRILTEKKDEKMLNYLSLCEKCGNNSIREKGLIALNAYLKDPESEEFLQQYYLSLKKMQNKLKVNIINFGSSKNKQSFGLLLSVCQLMNNEPLYLKAMNFEFDFLNSENNADPKYLQKLREFADEVKSNLPTLTNDTHKVDFERLVKLGEMQSDIEKRFLCYTTFIRYANSDVKSTYFSEHFSGVLDLLMNSTYFLENITEKKKINALLDLAEEKGIFAKMAALEFIFTCENMLDKKEREIFFEKNYQTIINSMK